MRTPEDFAATYGVDHLAPLIRHREGQVLAEALAEFEREDTPPFFGHGHTEPGYWRLVDPKHYKPLPEAPSEADIQALRELLGSEQKDQP